MIAYLGYNSWLHGGARVLAMVVGPPSIVSVNICRLTILSWRFRGWFHLLGLRLFSWCFLGWFRFFDPIRGGSQPRKIKNKSMIAYLDYV